MQGVSLLVTLKDLDFPIKPIILKSRQIKTELAQAVLLAGLFCLPGVFLRKTGPRKGNLHFRGVFKKNFLFIV